MWLYWIFCSQGAASVIIDAGVNVGPGASFKARAGLVILNYIDKNMANAALMKLMWGAMKKSESILCSKRFHALLLSHFDKYSCM